MNDICTTCLSANRQLMPLTFIRNTTNLCGDLDLDGALVCFECRACVVRFQQFAQRALQAKMILKQYKGEHLQSLSRLHNSTKSTYDETFVFTEVKDDTEIVDLTQDVSDITTSLTLKDDEEETIYGEELCTIEECKIENTEDMLATDLKKSPTKKRSGRKKKKSNKKGKPTEMKLSKDEEKFIIKKMNIEELYEMRAQDMNGSRYKSCPYKCINCITGYFSEDKYNAHIKMKHLEKLGSYKCIICTVHFKRRDALEYHYDCHFRRYHCPECPSNSHRLSTMLIHHTEQHALLKYQCTTCGEEFLKSRQLRYHVEKTHKERPKCHDCGKSYVNTSILKKHIALMHGGRGGGAGGAGVCGECGGTYRQLAAHRRTHAPPHRDAYCAPCGVAFRTAHTYRRHLRAHSTHLSPLNRRHGCTHCPRRFTSRTNLERHVGSQHTQQFPFTCDSCGKGFTRRDRLKYHIQEKHEDKPRPKDKICNFCGKGFKERQVLRNHLRTHTGERPHQCARCPAAFAQRAALQAHRRAIHPPTTTDI